MIGQPASVLLMLASCRVLCLSVLLCRRHHLELCFENFCSVKRGRVRQELQKYLAPLLFADAAWLTFSSHSLSAAIPLTSWSLHFPLSPFLFLRWLPLATPSRHQMAKAGGRGDALVFLSLYHLAAPCCHFPVLIPPHSPSLF